MKIGTNAIMLDDLENTAAQTKEFCVSPGMAQTAATLYRLLDAQGEGGRDSAVLVNLIAGRL